MTTFVDQFAACVQRERERLALAFGPATLDDDERLLREALRAAWRPLPRSDSGEARRAFAIDGSQGIRHFNNGWSAVVCHALCVGPGLEAPSVEVRFFRSNLPEAVLSRYAGLLMRLLELRVALAQVNEARGAVLCLDGSLHTALPHLLYPLDVEGERDLPLRVLATYLDLLSACRDQGVLLLSLAKTSTGAFLGEALMRLQATDWLPGDADLDDDPLPPLPTDVEALFRWTDEAGLSRPLVLGSYGFGRRRGQLLRGAAWPTRAFQGPADDRAGYARLLERLAETSATVSLYVRLRPRDDVLRLDLPAWSVGVPDRIRDTYLRWADDARLDATLGHLVGAYGGRSVYHAALYVADRLVRLSSEAIDQAYLSIIRAQLGAFVQYDRSRRRFLG
ncbi:MAG: DNA double-strand break repair nuclease NurA [Chloroflexi bacterium]|nr:DNA double-strand break repair nuclease NurA [Chloroflexota bacterium]